MVNQKKMIPSTKPVRIAAVVLVFFTLYSTVFGSGPGRRRYSAGQNAIGIRAGWVGAPNGFTWRHVFGNNSAFEVVAGYNIKEGRRTNLPFFLKGNSMYGISYQPFVSTDDGGNLAVVFFGDIGLRIRAHHYRNFGDGHPEPIFTPDFYGGLGIQFEFSEKWELFSDIHARYYNRITNIWTWALESGIGLRVKLW